jgi:hypothetical protein
MLHKQMAYPVHASHHHTVWILWRFISKAHAEISLPRGAVGKILAEADQSIQFVAKAHQTP